MPCFFCIAAIGIAAATIVPALVDRTEQTLQSAAQDLRRVKNTQSMVMWTGTFQFQTAAGELRTAATTVTVYKSSKRARIQCLTHELPHAEMHELQDFIANLMGATVLDRVDGDPALLATEVGRENAAADPMQAQPTDRAKQLPPRL